MFEKTKLKVIKWRFINGSISTFLILATVVLLLVQGFNLGIDFESGLSERVQFSSESATIETVRETLKSLDGVKIQEMGKEEDHVFQIRVVLAPGADRQALQDRILSLLSANTSLGQPNVLESNFIGAKFSGSLISGSIKAVLIALGLILIYVWVRFKVAYAISAILALMHDVICLLGFICLMRFEVSSTTIAAILTIIGYSLNNTIVIFDRIRSSIKQSLADGSVTSLEAEIDKGVSSSMSRTTFSSVTTLLAVIPLGILASGDLQAFAICMLFGVLVGTFSSNFIAPVFLWILAKFPSMDPMKEEEEDLSDAHVAQSMLEEKGVFK